jgi:hypothetical protein
MWDSSGTNRSKGSKGSKGKATTTSAGESFPQSEVEALPSADPEAVASEAIRRANLGMAANPSIDSARFRPIETSHGSRSHVIDWLKAGIAADLILSTVEDRAAAYEPGGRRTQISTMSYFDGAVREAAERADLSADAKPYRPPRRNGQKQKPPQTYDYSNATKEFVDPWGP